MVVFDYQLVGRIGTSQTMVSMETVVVSMGQATVHWPAKVIGPCEKTWSVPVSFGTSWAHALALD